MKNTVLLLFFALFLSFCSEPEQASSSSAARPENYLETGIYYIREDSTNYKRQHQGTWDRYFLDPKPIVHVKQFTDLQMSNRDGYSIYIYFDNAAANAFADATEKAAGKKLGVVIDNNLVMAPTVHGRIEGNSVQVAAGLSEEENLQLFRQIRRSMDQH